MHRVTKKYGPQQVATYQDADISDSSGEGLSNIVISIKEDEDATDHQGSWELEEVWNDGYYSWAQEYPADMFHEGAHEFVFTRLIEWIVNSAEDVVVFRRFFNIS